MPFCPKCRYEYSDGVNTCPDCEIALVSVLPEPDEPSNQDEAVVAQYDAWVPLVRLTSTQYAEMVVEALHSAQIPAVIKGGVGHFGSTGQMGMSSFRAVGGGYTLAVPAEFADSADAIGVGILGEDWEKARLGDL